MYIHIFVEEQNDRVINKKTFKHKIYHIRIKLCRRSKMEMQFQKGKENIVKFPT